MLPETRKRRYGSCFLNYSITFNSPHHPLNTHSPCRPFAKFKISREKNKTKWWQFENFEAGCYRYYLPVSIGFCITIQVNGNARLASRRPIASQKLINCRSNASVNEFSMISEVSQTNIKLILLTQSVLTQALTLLYLNTDPLVENIAKKTNRIFIAYWGLLEWHFQLW